MTGAAARTVCGPPSRAQLEKTAKLSGGTRRALAARMTQNAPPPFLEIGLALGLALSGCGGDGGGGGANDPMNPKAPYPRYSETTTATMLRTLPGGETKSYESRVAGTVTIGGEDFTRVVIGDDIASGGTSGVELIGNLVDKTTVEVIGAGFATTSAGVLGVPAYVSVRADEPITVDIEPPVGEAQAFSVSGSGVFGSPDGEPMAGTLSGTYTLEEVDVTVDSPMGAVDGCSHYRVEAMVPILFGVETPVNGDVWHHPNLGIVKAELEEPLAGLSVGLAGSRDVKLLDDGWATVARVASLGSGASESSFTLSTYDAEQAFNADKDTHAKMLLEVRFADEGMAKSETQPAVSELFATDIGYYPSMFVASPVSFLFPEENGAGYTHWIAFVDQAAKNQNVNGISYNITASYDAAAPPVRVAARILYKRIP